MTQTTINNGDTGLTIRTALNDMIDELYDGVAGLNSQIENLQPSSAQLTALGGASWASGTQVFALTGANTVSLLTVGAATGNILNKAAGDTLYLGVSEQAADSDLLDGQEGSYYSNASNLSTGTLPAGRFPALTGDITTSGGTLATTLAAVNSNAGTFGSTSSIPVITTNAKGLITAVSTASLGTSAVKNTGTSGNTVPLLDGANTWASAQTFSGKITTAASTSGSAGFNLPHGSAPTAPTDGDIWSTTTSLFSRINGSTKTIAFLDSNISGSAATLTTGRTIAMTGDVSWTSASFDGSGNVTGTSTLATVNSNTGSFGSGTAIPVLTVNGKGLITAVSTSSITGVTPIGGTTGQVLTKNSGTNYDYSWATPSAGGGGGPWYFSPPSAAGFTDVYGKNAINPSYGDSDGGLYFNSPYNGSLFATKDYRWLMKPIDDVGLDWEITTRITLNNDPAGDSALGIAWRDSGTGEYNIVGPVPELVGFFTRWVLNPTTDDVTSGNISSGEHGLLMGAGTIWCRVSYDASDNAMKVKFSYDGINWPSGYEITTYGATVDRIGFGVYAYYAVNLTRIHAILCDHWTQSW